MASSSSYIDSAKTLISENLGLGGLAQKIAPAHTQFTLDDVPDQSGKVAVITGATEGIGFGVTHTLLSKNISKVFMLSLSEDKANEAKSALKTELGEEIAARTTWIQVDMGDWERLKVVVERIKGETERVDVLVGNAGRGIMTAQITERGIDRHIAVNHFGHVILTSHLLPLLKTTADNGHTVRISMQSSNLHESTPKDTKFASVDEINKDLGPNGQYARAKLANLLYARYLSRHLSTAYPKILANATHPGIVSTNMSINDIHEPYPVLGYGMSTFAEPFKKDQFEGALSTLFATTKIEETGLYICPPAAIEEGSELSRDEELAEQLMKLTGEVIKEKLGAELDFY